LLPRVLAQALALAVLCWAVPVLGGEASGRPDGAVGKQDEEKPEELPLIALPKAAAPIKAEYPQQAFDQGLEAVVKLEIVIDEAGAVTEAQVLTPAGHGFDEAAVEALLKARFEPARTEAGPVSVRVTYDYHFTIKTELKPVEATPRGTEVPETGGKTGGTEVPQGVPPDAGTEGTEVPEGVPPDAGTEGTEVPEEVPQNTDAADGSTPLGADAGTAESIEPAGPTGQLRGRVLEAGARLPLGGLTVYIKETRQEATTAGDGSFDFGELPPGQYSLFIAVANFKKFETKEQVEPDKATEVLYYLRRKSGSRYETVVRGKKAKKEVTIHVIQREEVQKTPGSFGDPVRVVQNMPGVARAPFGVGMIAVRGAEPQDTGVFVDGHEVPLLFHFLGGPSVLPFEIVDSVDFYPGGTGPRFGNRMAGIIDVRTRPGRRERIFGQADIDLIDAGGILEGPLGENGAFILGIRRSYVDALLPVLLPDDLLDEVTVAPRYWDYQGRYDYKDGNTRLSAFAFGSDDLLTFLREEDRGDAVKRDDFRMQMSWHRLLVDWHEELAEDLHFNFSPGVLYSYNDVAMNQNDFTLHSIYVDLRTDLRWQALDNLALTGGVEGGVAKFFIEAAIPFAFEGLNFPKPVFHEGDPVEIDIEGSTFRASPYLELEWKPLAGVTVLPGLRADISHFHGTDLWAIDPRLTVRWEAMEDFLTLKTNLGLFSQWPDMFLMIQNNRLESQRAFQATVGAELKLPWKLEIDVQVFGKYLFDLVVFDEDVALSGEISALPLKNIGEGRAWGAELLLRRPLADGIFGWISYTIQRSERRAPGSRWDLYAFDQTHILTLVGSWEFWAGWTIGVRFRLVSGNPNTPVKGAVYDADSNSYMPEFGRENSERLPLFHQLDVRLDKKFAFNTWYLSFYIDVQNVYNQRNPEGYQYSYDFSKRVEFPGLPIIPTIGIKGEF